MKKLILLLSIFVFISTLAFSESTKKRYTYFSSEEVNKINEDAGYWIYGGLSNVTNYDATSVKGSKGAGTVTTDTTKGVIWDSTNKCATFDGASYAVISNPLTGVDDTTGFSITCEFYATSSNSSWERLFDLSSGSTAKYFMINAGPAKATNHMCVEACYSSSTTPGSSDKYRIILKNYASQNFQGAWHNLTLQVSKDSNMYLYIDGTLVSSSEDSECIPNEFGSKTLLKSVLNGLSNYTTCYIGTSVFQTTSIGADQFFYGKIRNYTFINTSDVFTITYDAKGADTVSSVVSAFIPDTLPEPAVPDGFTFGGWYMDEAYTTEAVPGAFIDEDTTLYAKYVHTHSDGTKYLGTNVLPPPFAGNWALINDVDSAVIASDVNLCLTRNITSLNHTASALSVCIDTDSECTVTTLTQTGGELLLTGIEINSLTVSGGNLELNGGEIQTADFSGDSFVIDGLIKITSLKLESGKVVKIAQTLNSSSEIYLSTIPGLGVITDGFGTRNLGSVINLPSGAVEYILIKTKSGELKISKHK